MNKVITQSGKQIIASGSKWSHIRNKEVFDVTIPKLIELLNKNWAKVGLERHTEYMYLERICEDDNLHASIWPSIIRTANFYSDLNKDNSIK